MEDEMDASPSYFDPEDLSTREQFHRFRKTTESGASIRFIRRVVTPRKPDFVEEGARSKNFHVIDLAVKYFKSLRLEPKNQRLASPLEGRSSLDFPSTRVLSLIISQVLQEIKEMCNRGALLGIRSHRVGGSIPVLHQVMSATRGATDIFSGATRHVNVFLKTTGVKNIEAGIGCGVGIGHGFGVGLALKPAVVHRIQSTLEQAVAKIMTKLGVSPDISSIESVNPGHTPRSIGMLNGSSGRDVQASIGSVLDLASNKKPMQNYELTDTPEEKPPRTRTEKVLNTFLQNPLFKPEVEKDLKELAGDLRSENNLLHVLLKHEQVIEELKEENQKLRRVLLEDLKVSPSKLQAGIGNDSSTKFENPCSDCFECRRRKRKSLR